MVRNQTLFPRFADYLQNEQHVKMQQSYLRCRRSRCGERLCHAFLLLFSVAVLLFGAFFYFGTSTWFAVHPHRRAVIHLQSDRLPIPKESDLINLTDFRFTLQSDVCQFKDVYLLALVHSTPSHVRERKVIRATWGGVRRVSGRLIRIIFLVGQSPSPLTQLHLQRESNYHGDLVQGNFIDSYGNLTYKHVMGLKWTLKHCNSSHFVLKVDEDAYVDIFQFTDFLLSVYGSVSVRTLMCNVYPEGTPALRQGKWKVPETDYPHARYPRYCGGLAYVIGPDVVRDLVVATDHVPFFWIDDVYVTGLLAEAVGLRHLSMNLRTTMDPLPLKRWLMTVKDEHPCRFFIGNLGDIADWTQLLEALWVKTVHVHNRTLST